jgi:hypothetical protein
MCRPNTLGGRRCPSHSNPVAIANRNARRRAQYAKSRGKTFQPETTHLGTTVPHGAATDTFYNPFAKAEFHNKKGEDLLHKVDTDQGVYDKLNITHETYAGELVDLGYFNKQQISGVINYNNLDENSYLEFGFKPTVVGKFNEHETMSKEDEVYELGKAEVANLTNEEKLALRIFTSNQYRRINRALYCDTEVGALKEPLEGTADSYFTNPNIDVELELADNTTFHNIRQTPQFLKELTGHIDSAMEKAPLKQRIVYRGMSGGNQVFVNATGGNHAYDAGTKWVGNNIKLGQEMVFDGYQSSSVDSAVALGYANGRDGVLFEIMTSSGINATSVSAYSHEKEVILPRNARYMVVGVHQNVDVNHHGGMNVVQLVEINEQGAVTEAGNHTPPPALTEQQLKMMPLEHWDGM